MQSVTELIQNEIEGVDLSSLLQDNIWLWHFSQDPVGQLDSADVGARTMEDCEC